MADETANQDHVALRCRTCGAPSRLDGMAEEHAAVFGSDAGEYRRHGSIKALLGAPPCLRCYKFTFKCPCCPGRLVPHNSYMCASCIVDTGGWSIGVGSYGGKHCARQDVCRVCQCGQGSCCYFVFYDCGSTACLYHDVAFPAKHPGNA